jgi:histidinol-phosphate/aromatic aminotransferase/cobyric acid decarboxylase-like protein
MKQFTILAALLAIAAVAPAFDRIVVVEEAYWEG